MIDPNVLETWADDAFRFGEAYLPPGPLVTPVLAIGREVFPPLIEFIARKVEGGGDPKASLLEFLLRESDAAADAAEDVKFGAGEPSTKPEGKK